MVIRTRTSPIRAGFFEFIEPLNEVPLEQAQPFNCDGMKIRHPRQTKGQHYDATTGPANVPWWT